MEENLNQENSRVPTIPAVFESPTALTAPVIQTTGKGWKLAILMSVFVLAGSIVYSGYQFSQKPTVPPVVYQPTPVIQLSPTPTPLPADLSAEAKKAQEEASAKAGDPTADWKTYTNNKYNFSIQYPIDFKTNEITSQYDDTFSVDITNQQMEREQGVDDDKMVISVIVGRKDFKRTDFYYGGYEWTRSVLELLSNVQNGVNEDHKYDTITKLESINVVGFTGAKYKAIPKQGTATEGFSTLNVALMKGDKTFLISGHTGNDILIFNTPYSKTFNQILSTFKFLE